MHAMYEVTHVKLDKLSSNICARKYFFSELLNIPPQNRYVPYECLFRCLLALNTDETMLTGQEVLSFPSVLCWSHCIGTAFTVFEASEHAMSLVVTTPRCTSACTQAHETWIPCPFHTQFYPSILQQ